MSRYEYGTSPRKIAPEYATHPKKEITKNNNTNNKSSIKIKRKSDNKKVKLKIKVKNKKAKIIILIVTSFIILFAIACRNSAIDQNFKKVQQLKQDLANIKKENDQLNINIANSLNLNNLEKQAKELLGMQKLTNKQTIYISLPQSDYIEAPTEKVIIEEDTNIFEKISNIFKK